VTNGDVYEPTETQALECKKSLAERTAGLKALNAMVNADSGRGTLVFGVAPDMTVVGLTGNLDQAQRSLSQHIREKFFPAVTFEIRVAESEGRRTLAIDARRAPDVPLCEYDGRAFIREGSEDRQLDLAEKLAIFRRRSRDHHPGPWKCDKCGATAMVFMSGSFDGKKWTRNCNCECGGEWWPAI
jgi:predicted HTH transcriptional regulator